MERTESHIASTSSVVQSGSGNVRQLVPGLADASDAYYSVLTSLVDPVLVELCRLRISQIVGNAEQMSESAGARAAALGIDAAQLDELAEWRDSSRFDAAQKACLEYAEYFCYSSESVQDEHVANLTPYLSPQQILSLTSALWISDAFHRMSNFLNIVRNREASDAPHPNH